jgi:L-asparaginase
MVPGEAGLVPARGRVEAALSAMGVQARTEAMDPLVDSAEVGPEHWNWMLDRVRAAPGPVLITHGTDTMAFTGAALDAALAGQGRRVVLCGSMHPLGAGRDAEANLALAIDASNSGTLGVQLAFAGRLLPAGAITKTHSTSVHAFSRSGDPAPAPVPPAKTYNPGKRLAILTLSPGLDAHVLDAMLAGLHGAVLRVYGAGTMPVTSGLAQPIARAVARGCKIVAVAQTAKGGLTPGAYAAGAPLWAAGVENGGRMSPEQALTRLWLRLSA